MKKSIFFAFVCFLSCSKSENSSPTIARYEVCIQTTCPTGIQKCYCISEATNKNIINNIQVGNACQWITFQTIDGITKGGYFRNAGTAQGNCSNN
ncbi:hypothetical protein [Flavobacterium sp.]|uniref:hypothetical protein n=1 Tax=Flavobacterium sp. TaxID=239 RepID=UPI003753BB8F